MLAGGGGGAGRCVVAGRRRSAEAGAGAGVLGGMSTGADGSRMVTADGAGCDVSGSMPCACGTVIGVPASGSDGPIDSVVTRTAAAHTPAPNTLHLNLRLIRCPPRLRCQE